MKHIFSCILLFALAMIVVGCETTQKPPARPDNSGDMVSLQAAQKLAQDAADAEREASGALLRAQGEQLSSAKTVAVAVDDNLHESLWELARLNVGLLLTYLKSVPENPELRAQLAEKRALYLAGQLAEVHASYEDLKGQADAQVSRIASLEAERNAALVRADEAAQALLSATADFERRLVENAKQNQQDIADAEQRVRDQLAAQGIKRAQEWCEWLGGICLAGAVLALLSIYFIKSVGAWLAGGLFVSAGVCFGMSQFVAEPWFRWSVAAFLAAVTAAAAVVLWRKTQRANMAGVLEDDRNTLLATMMCIARRLDALYEDRKTKLSDVLPADATVADFVDDMVFEKLGMTDAEKERFRKAKWEDKALQLEPKTATAEA